LLNAASSAANCVSGRYGGAMRPDDVAYDVEIGPGYPRNVA
jgi:hypothetical protein